MSGSRRIDWGGLMRAGLHGLGLRPWEFWALTPAELSVMLGVEGRPAPLTREGLAALMRAYPDPGAGARQGRASGDGEDGDAGCERARGVDRRA